MTFRCSWIYPLHTISASLKDIIASNVKTKIRYFSVIINSSLQYVYCHVHLSFLFGKILSYKIYIGMTYLQYVYAHVQLSIPLQKMFSQKIYIGIASLQYVYAHVQLSVLLMKILFFTKLHVNDFSCPVKTPFRENPSPHILHWNNFSPVCVHLCSVKFLFMENTLSQNWHCHFRRILAEKLNCYFQRLIAENIINKLQCHFGDLIQSDN